ncbi:MAG: hypothetical protein Q8N51_13135, partial [Gammaproteobacteria bacterium]|nr:hypothetical protein [Gammaproteobacteria bacterium]
LSGVAAYSSFTANDATITQSGIVMTGSTANLSVGMSVSGTGVKEGAVITKIIDENTFMISGNSSAAVVLQRAGSSTLTFSKTPTLVLTGSTAAVAFNPIGSAEIVLKGGNLVLDSKGATLAGIGPVFDNKVTVNQASTIQSVINAARTVLGSGTNGITINSVELSSTRAADDDVVTVASTADLRVGQIVSGTGIAAGTTILSIDSATQLTLSNNATEAGTDELKYGGILTLDAIAGGRPATDPGANLVIAGNIVGDETTALVVRSTQKNGGTTITAANATIEGVAQETGFASQSGVVTLIGNNTGFLGTLRFEPGSNLRVEGVNALSNKTFTMAGGTLQLLDDGDGTGSKQTPSFAFNHNITVTGNSTLAVGRTATSQAPYFTQAANKTAQISTLNIGRNTLTVTNNNNYGLVVSGTTTLTGASTFTVSAASSSNMVPGLHLSGQVTGNNSLLKNGGGTLLLSNETNNFGGPVSFSVFGSNTFGSSTTLTTESVNKLVVGQRLTDSTLWTGTRTIVGINVQNFAATRSSAGNVLTLGVDLSNLFTTGMAVSGAGIASGTIVTAVNNNLTTASSGAANQQFFTVADGTAFRLGEVIFGTGIPGGTYVSDINGNMIKLSQSPTQANPDLVRRQVTLSSSIGEAATNLVLSQINLNNPVTSAGTSTLNTNSMINISGGVLAFTSDEALGHASNQILLNTNSATAGARADGTFSTSRTFFLNQTNNSLEITQGSSTNPLTPNVFTINSAFQYPNAN